MNDLSSDPFVDVRVPKSRLEEVPGLIQVGKAVVVEQCNGLLWTKKSGFYFYQHAPHGLFHEGDDAILHGGADGELRDSEIELPPRGRSVSGDHVHTHTRAPSPALAKGVEFWAQTWILLSDLGPERQEYFFRKQRRRAVGEVGGEAECHVVRKI